MESGHPGEEAQAIALLMREVLEKPEKRVALVTPDRALAGRVVAHLARWGIGADDSGGQPLSQTLAGRFLLLLAEVAGEQATPVPLIALLGHPLVKAGRRAHAGWKACARSIFCCVDRAPMPGLNPSRG
jgi:ATP-dependent helicase/nuclease subunit B